MVFPTGKYNLINVMRAKPTLCDICMFTAVFTFSLISAYYGYALGSMYGYPVATSVICYAAASHVGGCAAEAAHICH